MILEFSIFIFVFSLFGMTALFLSALPRLSEIEVKEKEGILKKIKERFRERFSLKKFKKDIILEKILRRIRILNLRLDVKISNHLQSIVQKRLESLKKEDLWRKLMKRKKVKK